MITVLAGGVGGARFLRGLREVVPADEIRAIVNVGDDLDRFGLRICPDLDTITYWLSGTVDPDQQWGRADESHVVATELRRFGDEDWFTLGDRDLAVHIHRTWRLGAGDPLSVVTDEIRRRFGVEVPLLPATDDRVETRITTADGDDLHFQEYWVRERGVPEVTDIRLEGADAALPGPGVVEALLDAETVLFAPSNPIVSIGTILAVPGIRRALRASQAPIVAVSPIIDGQVVRGMADRLLPVVGAEVSAAGVAAHYGPLIDGYVLDTRDAAAVDAISAGGVRCVATDTLMDDVDVAAALARTCLELGTELGG